MPFRSPDADKFANADVGIRMLFLNKLTELGPDPLEELAWNIDSDSASEDYFFMGDAPYMRKWKGDRLMAGMRGAKFNIANEDFATGMMVHQNDIDDGKLNRYRPQIDEMAVNARYFKTEYITKTLLNGFTGNLFPEDELGTGVSFDGAQFFSASHSMFGGAPQSNLVGNVVLNEANLAAAQLMLRRLKTWDGKRKLRMRGTHLIVGPKLEKTAIELISASFLINAAGTATRDNSYFKGRYTLMVSDEIDGAQENWWFLADLSKSTKPIIWQNRRPIETSSQVTSESDGKFKRNYLHFGVDARAGVGLYDPRTIVGANPASG